MLKKKIICIIPARSGSKRLKNKNILNFRGKPLFVHSIIQSRKSKFIYRTIVSTDSEHYRRIALKYGAEAPFLRPKKLSLDTSTDFECFDHCLKYLKTKENYNPNIIVHLRPTYPLRPLGLIDKCIKFFINNKKAQLLKTICKFENPIEKLWYRKNNILFNPITKRSKEWLLGDQSLQQTYIQNACIDILKVSAIKKKYFNYGEIIGYYMKDNLDINTLKDLKKINK